MLVDCLKKLGKQIPAADREEITDAFEQHRGKGLGEHEAGLEALSDYHQRLHSETNELRRAAGLKPVAYERPDWENTGQAEPQLMKSVARDGVGFPENQIRAEQRSFGRDVDKVLTHRQERFAPAEVMSSAPPVLRRLGLRDAEIIMPQSVVEKAIDKHGISPETLKQLPAHLNDPVMVFASGTDPKTLMVLTDLSSKDGRPVVAAVKYDARVGRAEVNLIPSVHGKDRLRFVEDWSKDGRLRYLNKEKSRDWLRRVGLQLPEVVQSVTTKSRILTEDDFVNKNASPSSTYGLNASVVQKDGADRGGLTSAGLQLPIDTAEGTSEKKNTPDEPLKSTATGTAPTVKRDGKTYEERPVLISELIKRDPDLKEYLASDKNNPPAGKKITEPVVIGQKSRGIVMDGFARIAQAISNGQRMIPAFVEPIEALRSVSPDPNEWKSAHTEDLLAAQTGGEMVSSHTLKANAAAFEDLRRVFGEQYFRKHGEEAPQSAFNGMMATPSQLQSFIDLAQGELRQQLKDAGYTDEHLAGRDAFYNNLQKLADANDKATVTYSIDAPEKKKEEEETHWEDEDAGRTTETAVKQIMSSPFAQDGSGNGLFTQDYGDRSDADKASEIAAKLLTGQEEEYGWDQIPDFENEKKKLLGVWADGIVEKNADFIREHGWEAFADRYQRIAGAYEDHAANKSDSIQETEGSEAGDAVPEGSSQATGPPEGAAVPADQGEPDNSGRTQDAASVGSKAEEVPDSTGPGERAVNPRSKVGKDIEARAVEQGLVKTFGGTAEYEKINLKALAANATNLINKDLPRALRIIHGEEDAPKGLTNQAVFNALDTYANENKDTGLQMELANSEHAAGTSKVAQAMRLMRERDPYSAVSVIQQVQEARSAKVSPKRQTTLMDNEIQKIDSRVKSAIGINQATWQKFVKSIEC